MFRITTFLFFMIYAGITQATSSGQMITMCEEILNAKRIENGQLLLKQNFSSGRCWGAFESLQDSTRIVFNEDKKAALLVCAPAESTLTQYIRVFVKYAEDNPQRLHEPFTFVALDALRASFPCE